MSDGDLCRAVDPQSGHLRAAYIHLKYLATDRSLPGPAVEVRMHLLDWLAQMLEPFWLSQPSNHDGSLDKPTKEN
jgi:hypothetical protein